MGKRTKPKTCGDCTRFLEHHPGAPSGHCLKHHTRTQRAVNACPTAPSYIAEEPAQGSLL